MALCSMLVRRSLNRSLSSVSYHYFNLNGSSPSLMLRSAAPSSQNQISCFRTSVPRASSRNSSFSNQQEETIGPDTILFEGCDYNHWLITMDFPKDPEPTPEQMVETYVQTLAQVVGSVEEAKRRMYACSTTTYRGFQAVMTEEMSEKFKGLPGVVFILPDSYIDPVNKEYGGDKYDNGVITHRPPPQQYRQRYTADRRPRNPHPVQNAPPLRNYVPPQHNYSNLQNVAPNPQQTYAPQRNYAPNQGPPLPTGNNNYAPNQRSNAYPTQTNPIPPYQRGSSQVGARDYGQPDNRDFRGDNKNIGSSYDDNYRQGPGTGFSHMDHRDNMQGQQNFPPMGHTRNDQGRY